jgi:hypothetical protein
MSAAISLLIMRQKIQSAVILVLLPFNQKSPVIIAQPYFLEKKQYTELVFLHASSYKFNILLLFTFIQIIISHHKKLSCTVLQNWAIIKAIWEQKLKAAGCAVAPAACFDNSRKEV